MAQLPQAGISPPFQAVWVYIGLIQTDSSLTIVGILRQNCGKYVKMPSSTTSPRKVPCFTWPSPKETCLMQARTLSCPSCQPVRRD